MKVILKQDVATLGETGDIVNVKDGFGRNFLIPRGLAILATASNVKVVEEIRRQSAHRLERLVNDAKELAKQLGKTDIVIPARVGEENRIFGTVTTQQVADVLEKKGLEIDRRKIELHEEIRALGVYSATIKLHGDVTADLKIQVVPEE
ncbi:MAG TPA: 50S ribosomal protein L9 [Rhodothermales bacterium]|nr:50S ribosomal protein L9 [Rhodothermales bacterium]